MQIQVGGDIVERQELLNGTQIVTLEGASTDGAWSLSGSLSWNLGLEDAEGEGDLTIARDGAEIFATLSRAIVREAADSGDADFELSLTYEIDGGAGDFDSAAGLIELRGVLAAERFLADVKVATR